MKVNGYHLAQVNIARMRAPLEDPIMKGFVSQIEHVNKLAENSPGFIWRYQEGSGDATYARPYDDDRILINMSVWDSIEALKKYVYEGDHAQAMKDRREWFEKMKDAQSALWWIEEGSLPTLQEAKLKLEYLQKNGPSSHVFTFQKSFEPAKKVNPFLTSIKPGFCAG